MMNNAEIKIYDSLVKEDYITHLGVLKTALKMARDERMGHHPNAHVCLDGSIQVSFLKDDLPREFIIEEEGEGVKLSFFEKENDEVKQVPISMADIVSAENH